ncbi:hypothetical protein [Peptoclostridium litorale]|nr:hypothetical protein [Peptoclostridium litorale]
MGGVMLFDFFIFDYMQSLFKPKSCKVKKPKKPAQRQAVNASRPSNTNSISNASAYAPQNLENTIEIIYGSQLEGCTAKSSNIVSSKEML